MKIRPPLSIGMLGKYNKLYVTQHAMLLRKEYEDVKVMLGFTNVIFVIPDTTDPPLIHRGSRVELHGVSN